MRDSHSYKTGLGIMSGTSLDGLDLAICSFGEDGDFQLLDFYSVPYAREWKQKLSLAHTLSGLDLKLLENDFSRFVADAVNEFLKKTSLTIDFIACHGHTIYHQPEKEFTFQMLNGALLAAKTGITTVCDFRTGDVAKSGNGAPLVPLGDALLFGNFQACLNLGGFANVSFASSSGTRVAYDIAPVNIVLNHLAGKLGHEYDKDGQGARSGNINDEVLLQLDALKFYDKSPPKSLGREWLETQVLPCLEDLPVHDALATSVAHMANQLSRALNAIAEVGEVMVSGGGCHNAYLMEQIMKQTKMRLSIPSAQIIDAKEAIIFALLGKHRLEGRTNVYAEVTGALSDTCSGAVYY